MTAKDIEYAIAKRLGPRRYTICPNVYWGMGFQHELDLCILTPGDWAWEIEIKTDVYDLKRDLAKRNHHHSNRLRCLFFAVPMKMKEKALELCPETAGIWVVDDALKCTLIRKAKLNRDAVKLSDKDKFKLVRLASMRLWDRRPKPAYDDGLAATIIELSKRYSLDVCGFDNGLRVCLQRFDSDNKTAESLARFISINQEVFPESAIIYNLKEMANTFESVTPAQNQV